MGFAAFDLPFESQRPKQVSGKRNRTPSLVPSPTVLVLVDFINPLRGCRKRRRQGGRVRNSCAAC
jgi:hypothetical protein